MKKVIFLLLIYSIAFTQQHSAFVVGANFYTYGFAIEFMNINNTRDNLLFFSLGSMKNSREERVESVYKDQGGKDFIYDKINYAYALRIGYGLKRNIFPPGNFRKVSIDAGVIAAPTLAILTPYYIDVAFPVSATQVVPKTVIYDPKKYDYRDIIGQANFFRQIGPMKITPGIHLNSFLLLQFYDNNSNWTKVIKLGIQTELFTKKLPIMATLKNKSFWIAPYIALYIGNKKSEE